MLHAYVWFNSKTIQWQNIITGQLYFTVFLINIKGILQPEFEKSIFDQIERSSVKTFTLSNELLRLKVPNKVAKINENCNLFVWCALA